MQQMSAHAFRHYRELVEQPGFVEFFRSRDSDLRYRAIAHWFAAVATQAGWWSGRSSSDSLGFLLDAISLPDSGLVWPWHGDAASGW